MSTQKLIETKTFIYGIDAINVSDEVIFSAISKAENEIFRLNSIKNKPIRLKRVIAAKEEELARLISFLDSFEVIDTSEEKDDGEQ